MRLLAAGVRAIGLSTVACLVAGVVVLGFGGRVAMRIIGALTDAPVGSLFTVNDRPLGIITFEGTLEIVTTAAGFGALLAAPLYAGLRPLTLRFGRWSGVAFGLALLALTGATVMSPDNPDFRRFGITPLNVTLFAALFLAFGAAVPPAYGWMERRQRGSLDGGTSIWLWLMALAALLVQAGAWYYVLVTLAGWEHAAPSDRNVALGVGAGLLASAATLLWASRRWRRFAVWAVAALVLAGGVRTALEVAKIFST